MTTSHRSFYRWWTVHSSSDLLHTYSVPSSHTHWYWHMSWCRRCCCSLIALCIGSGNLVEGKMWKRPACEKSVWKIVDNRNLSELDCTIIMFPQIPQIGMSLQWYHNGRDGVSNHRSVDCLPSCLFRRRSKKTSKLHVTGFVRGIHRWPMNSLTKGQ